MLQLQVNGSPMAIPGGSTAEDLVVTMGLSRSACAFELNRRVVPRRDRATTPLTDGDAVEIVTLVGGG
jgi:thiamine biosynthesis protein ThiS